MPVFYNKIEKGNPQKPTEAKKWYVSLKKTSQVSEKEVAKLIADETTMNRKEVEMALDQFEKILVRLLLDGHSVQLGDWGSFHLSCTSEGSTTEKEVSVNKIKNVNIRFTAGKEMKEALKNASFLQAESIVAKKKKKGGKN